MVNLKQLKRLLKYMKINEIKVRNAHSNYSIIIGNKILNLLKKRIKSLCPKTKKIAIVIDKKVPKKYKTKIKKLLKNYELFIFEYSANEKLKSFSNVNKITEKILSKNFNRTDLLIAMGGGIIGDFSAFAASIIKRGINFINIPSTLLAQVDSSIGGKTGVNSVRGKNLLGSFYQPRLVLIDVSFLSSLNKREMTCGYAEILKHSLILKNNFFKWLKINSKKILENRDSNLLKFAIYKSCKIKLYFVNRDFKENNDRMILNFGHTFAHAIEAHNKFSRKINHGEAVLIGMIMSANLSLIKRVCSKKTLLELFKIYKENNLVSQFYRYFKKRDSKKIINFMTIDKKNNDQKINLILLKNIGKTTKPGSFKLSVKEMSKYFPKLFNFNL